MQGGKELHRPLMRDYRPFLEARSDLSGTVRMLRDGIESKELASIEEREGRSPRWHRLHILRMARALRASVPQSAKPSAADLQGFDRAIAEFAQAVKALEAAQDPVGDRVVNEANAYIGKLRRLRQDYGRPTFSLDSSLSSLDISVATLANAAQGRR
jgi:cbb3-type cytochrome oxidase cytochrome c subunit